MFDYLLKDKIVLITGGSKGLGRAMAVESARQGAKVMITYKSDHDGAQATVAEIKELNPSAIVEAFSVSVLDQSATTSMVDRIVKKYSRIDCLINNAGLSQFLPLPLIEEEDWDRTVDLNLKGVYLTTQVVVKKMVRQKFGAVLNIGSLAGVRILAAPVDYCASKAGIKGFTEGLTKEVGRYNIRVNCLAPGILDGGVARNIPENKLADFIDQLAIKRIGTFDEVAKMATFLISDLNSYMSGETVIMDGGL